MPKVKKSWLGNLWEKVKIARRIIVATLIVIPFLRTLNALAREAEKPGGGAEKKQRVLKAFGGLLKGLPWKISPETRKLALRVAGWAIDIIVSIKNWRARSKIPGDKGGDEDE